MDLLKTLSVAVLLVLIRSKPAVSISCYNCSGVARVADCDSVAPCSQGEVCYQEERQEAQGPVYDLGCRLKSKCQPFQGSVIGRRFLIGTKPSNCSDCCESEMCNRKLCWSDTACRDSHDIDCATVNSLFNVCHDTAKAKLTCKRFCGLCDIIDGELTLWSDWSTCDVTCGNGTASRTRTCSNPAPQNGGSDCVGARLERQTCQEPNCPVHGGWSAWSPWGKCSVTCGAGLQRRDRSCSNPYPDRHGDHCYGDVRDDRICTTRACADGGWSDWNGWSSCSVSCGNGFKTRSRECTNPAPSAYGRYCAGQPMSMASCSNNRCPDGGWSDWNGWSSCSVTCGNGFKTRSRDCTNPAPSAYGRYCAGQPMSMASCSNNRCPDIMSSFTVTRPNTILNGYLTFSSRLHNLGGDFSPTTGIFTCSKPGVYVFTFILVKTRNTTRVDLVACILYRNNNSVIHGHVDPTDDDTDKGSAYAGNTALVHLDRGDTVTLQRCTNPKTSMESWTSFSGFLLYPDV